LVIKPLEIFMIMKLFKDKGLLFGCLVFLAISMISVKSAGAQTQTPQFEGKIRFLVTSNWTKMISAVDYLSKQSRERATYMWGNRAEWKQYTEMYFTPKNTLYQDSEERAEPDDDGFSWRPDIYTIRRDLEKQGILDMIQFLGKVYIIKDTLQPQNWKILNDIKEVAGHICMDAFWEDTLKHQKVVAWFAMDIPVSSGPERFCGLPGMILEVDMNEGAKVITADKIDLMTLTHEMDLPKKMKGKHIHEDDYTVIMKKHIEERKANEEPWFWGVRY
jgi:GLPGLI family protein